MDNAQLITLLIEAKAEPKKELRTLLIEAVITELKFQAGLVTAAPPSPAVTT